MLRPNLEQAFVDIALALFRGATAADIRERLLRVFNERVGDLAKYGIAKSAMVESFLWDRLRATAHTQRRNAGALWVVLQKDSGDTRTNEELFRAYFRLSAAETDAWCTIVAESEYVDTVRSELTAAILKELASAKSLPWRYEAVVCLPFSAASAPYIGDGAQYSGGEIARLTEEQRATFDLDKIQWFSVPHGEERDLDVPNSWRPDRYYMVVNFDGYVSPNNGDLQEETSVVPSTRDEVKSVLGLCVACDLLVVERYASRATEPFVVFRQSSDEPGLVCWLPDDENAVIRKLREATPEGVPAATNARRQWHAITAALRRPDERLLNAARWLFGSYSGSNQLLQLVQAAVCLEILLGDKKESNELRVSQLLANRAAYLIATSRSNRDELLAEVREIYAARSRIVHSGGNRLGDDIDKLERLRTICKRIIQKELTLFVVVE